MSSFPLAEMTRARNHIAELERQVWELEEELTYSAMGLRQLSYYLRLQVAEERNNKLERQNAELERKVQRLLDHCPDAECFTCGEIICPHGEPLHFHHDGCPACEAAAQIGQGEG